VGGQLSGTGTEHVSFVTAFGGSLEQGSDSSLNVDGILVVSIHHTDAVCDDSILGVNANWLFDVWDGREFL